MNQKKNTKILMILIIIISIIILVGGVAFAYLTTDIFRSEKELFFKYVTQISDSEKGLIDSQLKQYFEKRKNTPYNNEGKFSFKIESEDDQEEIKNINNFNISFSGKVDTLNSKAEQNVSLNYSDEVKFPINYKQIENTIGLQTKYVGNKFIAIETDKLGNLIGEEISSEIDVDSLEKASQITLTDEQKKHIKNTYMEVLNEQLAEEKFSKVEQADVKGYKLTLTGEEVKNVLLQLLETLKNDQTTLDIINQYLGIQEGSNAITADNIDEMLETINEYEFDIQNLEITVYVKSGEINKITISTNEGTFNVEKIKGNDIYKILFSYETTENIIGKISLGATFEGLESMQSIKELYEIELQYSYESEISELVLEINNTSEEENTSTSQQMQYKYQLENNVNFTDSVDIEDFTNDNSMILTDYESEQVYNFLEAVVERIISVNKQQMEELGLEESENPIFKVIPSYAISTSQSFINKSNMSEEEINTFNEKFENYEGTNQQAQTLKGLLSIISLNNEDEDTGDNTKITEINFNGEEFEATEENITSIRENIDMEKNYRIEFEKDQDTGIIYRAVINER